MLVNGEPVDAFSMIVHRDKAEARGRALAAKLKEVIPSQLYQVAIQAAIGGKIIARESVSRHAQRRDREMLWRRHHAQTQAPREAEGRKKTDEEHRSDQHPAGSVHPGAEDAMMIDRIAAASPLRCHPEPRRRRGTSHLPMDHAVKIVCRKLPSDLYQLKRE